MMVLWRKMEQGREMEITEKALQCSTVREVSPRAPEGDRHQHSSPSDVGAPPPQRLGGVRG